MGPQEPLGGGGGRGSKQGQVWEQEEMGRILSPEEGLRGVEKRRRWGGGVVRGGGAPAGL